MDDVSEEQCLICRYWPEAERPKRRLEYFYKRGVILIPVHDMCPACSQAWAAKSARKH
jgi:hypothetical protein